MKSIKALIVVTHLCLGCSAFGCVTGSPTEGDEALDSDEGEVGEAEQAWSLDAPQRGWVDAITRTCYNRFCFGPVPYSPAEYKIQGWACLKPSATATSLAVTVYQGGPPGVGIPMNIVDAQTEYRPDTVIYGACANVDSGFNLWVNSIPNVPKVFYVSYHALFPAVTLEGTSNPDM